MAIAQNLKVTQNVDDRVRGVDAKVDRVGSGVKVLIDGTSTVFVADCWSPKLINPDALGEREAKVVMERTANEVYQVKRSSSHNYIHMDMQAQPFFAGS